ncbi:MAG: P-loop NTPase fold protein [Pseudomonadota bacterium]
MREDPVKSLGDDRLGFADIAQQLGEALYSQPADRGFVVGVSGPWGSGKSSIVSMALSHLGDKIEVLHFEPWLVGDRDELLAQLFELVRGSLTNSGVMAPDMARQARKLIDRFVVVSNGAARLARIGAATGILPGAGLVADGLDKLNEAVGTGDGEDELPDLKAIKDELTKALTGLKKKLVVFVDDLDRLNPDEAVEVLRLIRAVADFPNVLYVLAYDNDVLAANLEAALKVPNGAQYLDKIVHASFRVPRALPYDLARWTLTELTGFLPEIDGRMEHALDLVSGLWLETPRDAVRLTNAMRLYATHQKHRIHLGDMVVLQMSRLKAPRLYTWIENYLQPVILVTGYPEVTPASGNERAAELCDLLNAQASRFEQLVQVLRQIVPGLLVEWVDEGVRSEVVSLWDVAAEEARALSNDQRLGSPDHASLYFSFARPIWALPADAWAMIADAKDKDATLDDLTESRLVSVFAAIASDMQDCSEKQAENALAVFIRRAEDIYSWRDRSDLGVLAGTAQGLFGLVPKVPDPVSMLKRMAEGLPIWLAVGLLWDQLVERGLEPGPLAEERTYLLTEMEFETFKTNIVARLESIYVGDLVAMRGPGYALYLIDRFGDNRNNAFKRQKIKEDPDLLAKYLRNSATISTDAAGDYDLIEPWAVLQVFETLNECILRLREVNDLEKFVALVDAGAKQEIGSSRGEGETP